jgi:hypothetical protein
MYVIQDVGVSRRLRHHVIRMGSGLSDDVIRVRAWLRHSVVGMRPRLGDRVVAVVSVAVRLRAAGFLRNIEVRVTARLPNEHPPARYLRPRAAA